MAETSGLVSAYQLLDCSAQRILRQNLAETSDAVLPLREISFEELLKLRENEVVKVRIAPEYEQIALALLVKRVPVQILPGPILSLRRGDLSIMKEAGIPYQLV